MTSLRRNWQHYEHSTRGRRRTVEAGIEELAAPLRDESFDHG